MSSNFSYVPSPDVRGFHHLPHLNAKLQERSGDFGITADSQWNSYTKSLHPIPIICGGLALLAVVLFQLSFSLYYYWRKKSALPYVHDRRVPTDPLRNCRIAFLLLFTTVIIYVQFIPVGNSDITTGVSTSNTRLDYLDDQFTSLTTEGNDLINYGNVLQRDFSNSFTINNCVAAEELDDFLPLYDASVQEYLSYVQSVPEKAKDFQDTLNLYAVEYKNSAVWMFYGWFIICPDIFLVGMFLSNRRVVYGAVGLAELIMTFVFLVCIVGMIILVRYYASAPLYLT